MACNCSSGVSYTHVAPNGTRTSGLNINAARLLVRESGGAIQRD